MRIASLVLILLLPTLASADVKIDVRHRRPNTKVGHCIWTSVETCGNHLGVAALKRITDDHLDELNGTWLSEADKELTRLRVGHEYRGWWTSSMHWLKSCTDAGRPVLIDFKDDDGTWHRLRRHAVVVVDVTDEDVRFIDTNDVDMEWFKYDIATFRSAWSGRGLAIWK